MSITNYKQPWNWYITTVDDSAAQDSGEVSSFREVAEKAMQIGLGVKGLKVYVSGDNMRHFDLKLFKKVIVKCYSLEKIDLTDLFLRNLEVKEICEILSSSKVKELRIYNNQYINADCLIDFTKIPKLQSLDLRQCVCLSEDKVNEFRKQNPRLKIQDACWTGYL